MITSNQNPRIKLVQALQARSRTRRKEGKIVLEGVRLVQDALAQGLTPDFVFHTPDHDGHTLPRAEVVSEALMKTMSDTQQPQGVIAVFAMPDIAVPEQLQRVLVLDAIRDPGNMGTILRAAAAAGVQVTLLSPDCVDPYNPKALRAGMGAHFRMPTVILTWAEIASALAPLQVYLATGAATQRYDAVDWAHPWALMIGSEAHGAGHEALTIPHTGIRIPMSRDTESLNAAMAASVILFEAQRQQL